MAITNIFCRKIVDSRNQATIEVDLVIDNKFFGRASAPGGKSVGQRETAVSSVTKAEEDINTVIKSAVLNNKEILSIKTLDKQLIDLGKLGTNATLPVSVAFAKALAKQKGKPLYKILGNKYSLPVPMFNVLNGGAHAINDTDIQEFMLVPQFPTLSEQLWNTSKVINSLHDILKQKNLSCSVGDEGGFAPSLLTKDALELLTESIEMAGFIAGKDFYFALDIAASGLYKKGDISYRQKSFYK